MADIAVCLNLQGNFSDARDMLTETLNVLKRSSITAETQARVSGRATALPQATRCRVRHAYTALPGCS
jgi:hypothetical protein